MKSLFIIFTLLFTINSFALEKSKNYEYVGYQACIECHKKEVQQWQTSHHNQAMQHASLETVLGNFNQEKFENYGLVTTFFKKGEQFWVNTDGPDGKLHDYEIKYTFGVYPLQQYLIEFPGGRLQALDIAWDARSKDQGGQRWYHLHPDEKIESDDILHWTGPNMNWNYMCAYCHSTNLEKNYKSETSTYKTSWSEINVSCEACHGPAQQHLEWANIAKTNPIKKTNEQYKNFGLSNPLNDRKNIKWEIDSQTHKPYRSQAKETNTHFDGTEVETCARCHSRRSQLGEDSIHLPLMDSFRPARLSSSLYYADGQIKDEVYVYGSFIQSKMHQAGVTCSDCHNPHTNALKLPGDQVCNQCHTPDKYRTEKHHYHKVKTENNISCLDCHMPTTTYMGVDDRHDHSFRIPRPDFSVGTDIPNACNKCHTTSTPQWSEQRLKDWYKQRPVGFQNFAGVLYAYQQQATIAPKKLQYLINDKSQPDIARASALLALGSYPDKQAMQIIKSQIDDNNPMIRLAALEALPSFDKNIQVALAYPLIYDEIKSIRMEAARILASIPEGQLSTKDKTQLDKAKQEYIDAQLFNSDRPESQVNLGHYYFESKDFKRAEQAFSQAIKLQPRFIPAYIAQSQLSTQKGDKESAVLILKEGITRVPKNADLHHTLGLAYIRQKKNELALNELKVAADIALKNIRYQYVYAVALNSLGQSNKAIIHLQQVHENNPTNTEILIALLTFNRDAGDNKSALIYAKKLDQIMPDNPDIKKIIIDLSKKINN